MYKAIFLVFVSVTFTGIATAQETLSFVGNFESGQIQKADKSHDGFYVKTLPDPQVGLQELSSGAGGFGPDAKADTRVVPSEIVGSETVRPRSGRYFVRSALYYDKNYVGLNDMEGRDKPRSSISTSDPAHRFDYDTESYLGFSIYVPRNYEHETGSKETLGAMQLLSVKEPTSAKRGFFMLEQFVPKGGNSAHWYFGYATDATSTTRTRVTKVDLGPVENDVGKWTDFVIRFRENPFAVDTNPATRGIAGAKNQLYEGNRGILQVWKAEGPVDSDGSREMALKIDKVNTPVGLVPHASEKRIISFRVYKYGWKKNRTTVKGPIWFGFDEIRLGFAKQGIGYADVDPSGQACAEGCGEPAAKPKPPAGIEVT